MAHDAKSALEMCTICVGYLRGYSYRKQEPFVRKRSKERWQAGVTSDMLVFVRQRKQTQVDDAKRDKNATVLTHL